GRKSRVLKSNVLIVDQTGRVLVKIRESTGVPLREVHKKPDTDSEGFSRLYYSYQWEKTPLGVEAAKQNRPPSILFFDREEALPDLYRERLRQAGMDCAPILVRPGESFEKLDSQSYAINPQSKSDFTRLFELLVEEGWPIENICFAWPRGNV